MKSLFTVLAFVVSLSLTAQKKVFPVIKNFGGIFDVPDAIEKTNPELDYKIVVELTSGSESPGELNSSLNSIARMINLHAIAGVPKEKIIVVVAIHGEATYSIMNNEAYLERFKTSNPNLALYKELEEAGANMFVCGQSLLGRSIDRTKMAPQVKIATSMLTTITTYQLM